SRPGPIAAPAGVTFTTVSAGGFHACAVATTGSVYCWGSNSNGQLGDGTTTDSPTPGLVSAPAGVSFTSVSAGGFHSCAIANAPTLNTAYCWGATSSGQLGTVTTGGHAAHLAVAADHVR